MPYPIVCAKCFNMGGTLEKNGKHYSHKPGQCGPLNWHNQHAIYRARYPFLYWRPLCNVGVDINMEELINAMYGVWA
jgi:hypothetical protein